MRAVTVRHAGQYLEKVEKKSTEVALLAHSHGIDIIEQAIAAGKRFSISPSEKSGFEFIYIVSGCLYWIKSTSDESGEERLGPGDHISAIDIGETAYFRTETDIRMLYVSSRPIFRSMSEEIKRLTAIARSVMAKDHYTHDHCTRLQELAAKTAERMRLPAGVIERIIDAAFLHDIGKIAVPDAVLTKPEPLTCSEWAEMKKHPLIGRDMLVNTPLSGIAEIVAQHHERPDGLGYPAGLGGDEITIEARIISVVDAYDAMTSDRSYRRARSSESAIRELSAGRGSQFDSAVVRAFLAMLKEEDVAKPVPLTCTEETQTQPAT